MGFNREVPEKQSLEEDCLSSQVLATGKPGALMSYSDVILLKLMNWSKELV
jgi:hypothetical protein